MRLFIAIDIPSEIKGKISSFAKEIQKKEIITANFVSAKNMHLTLKFLGEVKDADRIKEACEEIKANKFKISFKGVGAFPSQDYARVLWIGVEKGAEKLRDLNKQLEKKLGKDEKEFSTHLTIARVKALKNKQALKNFFIDKEFGEFEAEEFKLIKSVLIPSGPVYEDIARFRLI